jgi:hypothetical protein
MKTLAPVLVATLLVMPVAALGEAEAGSEPAAEEQPADAPASPEPESEDDPEVVDESAGRSEAAKPRETPVGEDGYALDEDDLVEVRGLVYDFFVEDDSDEKLLGIEAPEGDYLVRGGLDSPLAARRGETVTVRGWLSTDESGDTWLWVEEFERQE